MARATSNITEAAEHAKTAAERIMANEMQPEIQNLAAAASARYMMQRRPSSLPPATPSLERLMRLKPARCHSLRRACWMLSPPYRRWRSAALRGMKQEERLRAVRAAVEAADESFVAAVVKDSHVLTGMGAAEQVVARDMWQRKWHADTLARAARLRAAQDQLDRVGALFTSWTGSIYAEKDAAVRAAEESAKAAREAMAKVD
jgi:hypothetical protein